MICDWADRLFKHYCSFIAPLCTDWLSVLVFAQTPAHAVSLTARTASSSTSVYCLTPHAVAYCDRPTPSRVSTSHGLAQLTYRCHFYNIISVTSLKKRTWNICVWLVYCRVKTFQMRMNCWAFCIHLNVNLMKGSVINRLFNSRRSRPCWRGSVEITHMLPSPGHKAELTCLILHRDKK